MNVVGATFRNSGNLIREDEADITCNIGSVDSGLR
jgi:hypothetical protein